MCNEVVERTALVKGYEFPKDQYVRFTDEELKALEGEASKVIDIAEFVPLAKVDPIYFEKTYYLGPDKGGEKAYRLLADAMAKTDRVALAKFVMRGKESLVLIRAAQGGLMLHTMYFADEVRDFGEIEKGETAKIRDGRAGPGGAADRRAVPRGVQARAVRGRVPPAGPRRRRAEGGGPLCASRTTVHSRHGRSHQKVSDRQARRVNGAGDACALIPGIGNDQRCPAATRVSVGLGSDMLSGGDARFRMPRIVTTNPTSSPTTTPIEGPTCSPSTRTPNMIATMTCVMLRVGAVNDIRVA